MQAIFETYRGRETTLHSWYETTQNQRFDSLETAIGYCRHHVPDLSAIELFVHMEHEPDPIISGRELEMLVDDDSTPASGARHNRE